jgi:hypothetical protein
MPKRFIDLFIITLMALMPLGGHAEGKEGTRFVLSKDEKTKKYSLVELPFLSNCLKNTSKDGPRTQKCHDDSWWSRFKSKEAKRALSSLE